MVIKLSEDRGVGEGERNLRGGIEKGKVICILTCVMR